MVNFYVVGCFLIFHVMSLLHRIYYFTLSFALFCTIWLYLAIFCNCKLIGWFQLNWKAGYASFLTMCVVLKTFKNFHLFKNYWTICFGPALKKCALFLFFSRKCMECNAQNCLGIRKINLIKTKLLVIVAADIYKAFNSISHCLLTTNLNAYGFNMVHGFNKNTLTLIFFFSEKTVNKMLDHIHVFPFSLGDYLMFSVH